ncbi:GNAT family N-acetyltransferase [Modestobacter sp. SYSU DS0511]
MTTTGHPAPSLAARPATPADAAMLLDWRNDPEVRRWSRTPDEVTPDGHARWLAAVLADPDRHLLVLERAAGAGQPPEPVATTRYDLLPAPDSPADRRRWEVSITVAPGMRGRGLGGASLRASDDWLAVAEPAAEEVVAVVLPGNEGSHQLFRRNGYRATPVGTGDHARYVRGLTRR